MNIYIGADHRGFALKEKIKEALPDDEYNIVDVGAEKYAADDDYPDFAVAVAKRVAEAAGRGDMGIVICGSGFGVDIVANKFHGVRSALASSPDQVSQGRHDDDVNVLALAADFTDPGTAIKIVKIFLSTSFAKEEKYSRRLRKIE